MTCVMNFQRKQSNQSCLSRRKWSVS